MNAAAIAAELARRTEAVCRRYLPHGRRQGRYWVAGDLLDLVRYRSGAPTLRAALAEACAFLALPAAPASGEHGAYDATAAARHLWRRCRDIDGTHAERYLHARGLARCRFAALRFHPALRYRENGSVIRLPALVAAVTGDDGAISGVQRT